MTVNDLGMSTMFKGLFISSQVNKLVYFKKLHFFGLKSSQENEFVRTKVIKTTIEKAHAL